MILINDSQWHIEPTSNLIIHLNRLQFDEVVPDEMDTDRGGFYINSGQLQYKRLSNFERDGETNERTPNPRKVNINDTSISRLFL